MINQRIFQYCRYFNYESTCLYSSESDEVLFWYFEAEYYTTQFDRRKSWDECAFTFTDEENASGFFNSKAQRERFAEYHDFPISLSSKQDSESGYHYFGARYYDSEALTGWLSVDPMSDKYPGISPYAYCAWTQPTGGDEHRWIKYNTVNNPVKLVDLDGKESSPIYDSQGDFLGTDDKGLQGKAIVMRKENFKQSMHHEDALRYNLGEKGFKDNGARKKFANHYAELKNRPDYDGFVTISEGIQWAKDHPNAKNNPTPDNTLYINAAQLDLVFLTVDNSGLRLGADYTNVNLYDYVDRRSPRSVNTTYALGNTAIKLLDNNGTVGFRGDVYDWDYHEKSPMRNTLIFLERMRTGLNDKHGFNISIYGTTKINQKWPF